MKIKFKTVPLVYPVPIVLAGATVEGKANFVTLGDCGIMGLKPPLVYISSHRAHYTNRGILQHNTYSINFPTTAMLAVTDYCGLVSGHDVDKGGLFETFYGELETAPMISACPVNLECRVIKEFSVEHRQIFVGEVAGVYVDESCLVERDGHKHLVTMDQLDPIIYGLDNRYYCIGDVIGTGFHEGRDFRPE